ncbi:MerR family DNA-binding protein, partial [Pseudomonas marginalis]
VDPAHHTCQESKQIVDERLADVESKIQELTIMRDSLKMLSAACCGDEHATTYCSILETLEKGAASK